ncbi:MAG: hypothetical protein CMG68_05135 [Candidatus Marinimicrobia bacterium]|nr:hypothetical protein [Candidatus Neomarinimicrobiota bacterium]
MMVDTFHLDHLSELFQTNRNRKNALDMSKYMKGHFYFFGIKSPLRKKTCGNGGEGNQSKTNTT